MQNIALNELWTLVAALLTIGLGSAAIARLPALARYSIPPAVVGGFLVAVLLLVAQQLGWKFAFGTATRSALLLVFFTSLGLSARLSALRGGGVAVALMSLAIAVLAIAQNAVGAGGRLGLRRAGRAGGVPGQCRLSGRPRHHRGLGRAGAGRRRGQCLRSGHGLRHAGPGGRRRARQRGGDPAARPCGARAWCRHGRATGARRGGRCTTTKTTRASGRGPRPTAGCANCWC